MIDTPLQPPRSEAEHLLPITAVKEVVTRQTTPSDYFLSTVVVVLGIVLGTVAALFIGLLTGWIEIRC